MEGEEDEEAIAPAAALRSSPEGHDLSDGLGTSPAAEGKTVATAASWKLGNAFKAAWQSTSSKVTAFVLRNSASVFPDEELPPASNQVRSFQFVFVFMCV
jgi:hypothetical protein